jgi:hypothetical protein
LRRRKYNGIRSPQKITPKIITGGTVIVRLASENMPFESSLSLRRSCLVTFGGNKFEEILMKQILAVALSLFFAVAGFAQTQSGLTGVVTDQAGAIVPGATVTLLDTKTGKEQTTITNDDGSYRFNSIEAGAGYKLTFARQGFQTYVLNEVQVSVGRIETQNVQLTAGAVSAMVEVASTSGEATLNTTDASVGNVINTRQLRELPIQIRGSPAALLGLQPGVIGNNVGTGNSNRVGSVTGSRADQGNITVDGIDANDQTTGQAFNTVANAPIDSVQEFRGTVAGLSAAEGRSSGGQVQLKTNSGTNEYHGNLREYYRNEKFSANDFFSNKAGLNTAGAPVSPRPKLRRHQFGGSFGGPLPFPNFGENDGPLFHSGKNKLFFFFDNERRRDRSEVAASRTVPLGTWRAGQIGYIRATHATTGAACPTAPRAERPDEVGCIGYLTPAQIQTLDPAGIGVNTALLNLYNSRFPLANDLTGGNGINTGLFRFNAPNVRDDNIYTTRFDAVPTDHQRIFLRMTFTHRDSTNSTQFLPGDEDAVSFQDRSFGLAAGHTWIITPNLTNVATVGETKQQNFFAPPTNQPQFPYNFSGGSIGSPFPSMSYQDRLVTVPTIKDDVTWTSGNHTWLFGGQWKPIRQFSTLRNDFTFVTLGLGGVGIVSNFGTPTDPTANTLRPADLQRGTNTSPAPAVASYDQALATMLGRIATTSTNYNLDASGTALAPGSGKERNYVYNEYEFYVQDNWKIRSDLTLNLGLRYSYYPAPYETNGAMATDTTDWTALLKLRQANAAAGIAGDSAEPFLVYQLAGKPNNGPDLYAPDKNNWAPRVGFAYSPSAKGGVLGTLFGERKSALRGSYGITYDRVTGSILFIQNQLDYLFQNSGATSFGTTNPRTSLQVDPRFTTVNTIPAAAVTTAPAATRPSVTPFVSAGVPSGIVTGTGAFNYTIDHNFKTPYSHLWDFGFQRELPGNHLIDIAYVGRMGRSLLVQSDAAQVTNFKDPASGQLLLDAFNNLQAQLQGGATTATVTSIPWFENQMALGFAALRPGQNCLSFGIAGVTNCTQLAASQSAALFRRGDTSDAIQAMRALRFIRNNVGLSAQFASNAYISNQGESDYHGLLVSLQKRFSNGFEYDLNYTFSKALDNQSTITNTVQGAVICDAADPGRCRSAADFDVRHLFNANFIFDLPVGRNRRFGGGMNRWVDSVVGGWTVSGILNMRSGLPFGPSPSGGVFPTSYIYSSPAVVTDYTALRSVDIRDLPNNTIQYFADPTAANAALRDPKHGEIGTRNAFYGPMFWVLDMGLAKKFGVPWSETQRITFRADAFNVTNTNIFGLPGVTRQNVATPSQTFGQITGSASSPREVQFALRWDF